MGSRIAIHANPGLKWQRDYGGYLLEGLAQHGIRALLTDNPTQGADIHIVLGPWFALEPWRYDTTLYVDRAYWGDPTHVSIHWLRAGEKYRPHHEFSRKHPELQPYKTGDSRVWLCDYRESAPPGWKNSRKHPSEAQNGPLSDVLAKYDIAGGCRTTALVDAAIAGLRVETDDPHSPVWAIRGGGNRDNWINNLAWHNWSIDEIRSGEFLHGIGSNYSAN